MRLWFPILLVCLLPVFSYAGEADRVFDEVKGSVVTITTLDEQNQVEGAGSGVVVGPGQVVTNCHVVQEASAIRVRSGDKELGATLEILDEQRDLCRLDVPELTARTVKTRGYQDIRVAEPVYAVGNPLGFGLAVSTGLVSAVGPYKGDLQIVASAPVSPGSSGGGLFDGKGRLIGITTRTFNAAQNLNISVPADWIAEIPSRGSSPRKAPEIKGPDPDWLNQAEMLRASGSWAELADWARRWREAYPTSADAGELLGLALNNLSKFEKAKQVLLEALQHDLRHAKAQGYLAMTRRTLGEKAASMEDLKRALALYPSEGYFWRMLAIWQLEDGFPEDALKSIQTAIRFRPWQAEAWEFLGEMRHRQGKFDEAIESYRTALRLKPDDQAATSNLAGALAAKGESHAARKVLTAAPAGGAHDAGTWLTMGLTEEKQGKIMEAERAYRKALELNPAFPEAWYSLAHCVMRANRTKEAEEAFKQAVKHKPDYGLAWANLGALLAEAGNKKEAQEAFAKAAALDPSVANTWAMLGNVRFELGEFAASIEALRKALSLDPSLGDSWVTLGQAQMRLGNNEEALKALLEAEKINPKNETTLQSLSMYFGTRGDSAKALEYMERALEINPASPNSWSNKGYALLQLKRYAEAVRAFETAIKLQPDFANAWINLGEALLRQNQVGKAIVALERALTLEPAAKDARLYALQSYMASGQHAKAKEHIDILLRQAPDFPPALYALATVNILQGNKDATLSAYAKLKSVNPAMAGQLREQVRSRALPSGVELPE